jgi:hypothetical protein
MEMLTSQPAMPLAGAARNAATKSDPMIIRFLMSCLLSASIMHHGTQMILPAGIRSKGTSTRERR